MSLKKISAFILSMLLAMPTNLAWADENIPGLTDNEAAGFSSSFPGTDTDTIEVAATEVETCCDTETFQLSINVKNGPGYVLNGAPYSQINELAYQRLNDADKEKFLATRSRYLGSIAAVLHSTRLVYGVGSLVKGKISQVVSPYIDQVKNSALVQGVKNSDLVQGMKKRIFARLGLPTDVAKPIEDIAVEIVKSEIESERTPNFKVSFRERVQQRSHDVVYQYLQNIDRKLWEQSRLVVIKNEISVSGSIAVVAISAAGKMGTGRSFSLGINTGYNSQSHELVFEFFKETDKLVYAYSPTVTFGIVPKVGIVFASHDPNDAPMEREGHSFYPPVAPGYTTTLNNMATVGFSTSAFGVPPFVGDAFTYLNKTSRQTLVRFTFSPLRVGFFRMRLKQPAAQMSCAAHLQ